MVKSNKSKTKTSGHTSVSNIPEELLGREKSDFYVTKPVSEEPSKGENPGTDEVNEDGTETVIGHKKSMEGELIHSAPDTSTLRDIGEASFGSTQKTVHGTDNRVQITNTAIYP